MKNVENVYQTLITYLNSNGTALVLFLIALYVVINQEKEMRKRYVLICFFSVLLIFNDAVRWALGHVTEISTYYRFFWAVPFLFVAAKALLDVGERAKGTGWKLLTIVMLAVCVLFGRVGVVSLQPGMMPKNVYNLSQDVFGICELIKEDKEQEQPRVVADLQLLMELRCYDPTLIWGVGRKPYLLATAGDWYPEGSHERDMSIVRMVCSGAQEDAEYLKKALKKRKVDYIVTYSEFGLDEYLAGIGYEVVGKSDTRTLYGKH